jgi:RND family efflux transporter MFP subunit
MPLRIQIVITTLLAVGLAGGWLWLSGPGDSAEPDRPRAKRSATTKVLVEPLERAQDQVVVRAIGTGDARKSATIHPSVSGEVTEIRFKAGQRVRKGEILVRLDDEHQKLALNLTWVALKKAKRDVVRLKKLAASGHASRIRLDTVQTELESASVRNAQAEADLTDRNIVAPFSGVIGLTEINVGDRVSENTMIATLDDRSTILVDFNLPEDYASRVRVGDSVSVRPSTTPERRIEGTVFAMGSRIEATSRSLKVRAQIANPDDRIRPGTSFEVALTFKGRSYPIVREIAVLWSRDGAYLWRAAAGKAEKVFVKLVRRNDGRILVDGPLKPGDLVVVEGVQSLRIGQRLDPQPFARKDLAESPSSRSSTEGKRP